MLAVFEFGLARQVVSDNAPIEKRFPLHSRLEGQKGFAFPRVPGFRASLFFEY